MEKRFPKLLVVKFVVLSLVLSILGGCANFYCGVSNSLTPELHRRDITPREAKNRREEYIGNHPELTPAVRDAIRGGIVLKGMTPDQVEASLGPPDRTTNGKPSNADYSNWYFYFKDENEVRYISNIHFQKGKVSRTFLNPHTFFL